MPVLRRRPERSGGTVRVFGFAERASLYMALALACSASTKSGAQSGQTRRVYTYDQTFDAGTSAGAPAAQ